jgi:protein involved in polysaccharide export with SLBB domain
MPRQFCTALYHQWLARRTWFFTALLLMLLAPYTVAQQDAAASLAEARAMCDGLTEENKSMAAAAGYDIGKLCRSFDLIGSGPGAETDSPELLVLPRGTGPNKQLTADFAGGPEGSTELDQKRALEEQRVAAERRQTIGGNGLKPFGYELFAGEPTTFEPASHIPISPDYLLGPGDVLEVLLFGGDNKSYSLAIGRNGTIDFPALGPIAVAGISFADAKQLLHQRIAEQILGVEVSISLGELRSIQVFILGEAYKPGSYTVSSLSTITNALFVSGGLNDIASLRNIRLKRAGKIIAELDLYDLLLHGDTSDDIRLQSGDVIHIPSVNITASVAGEVRRPAIYELKKQTNVKQLLELAGGLLPGAYASGAVIDRFGDSGFKTVVDIDLKSAHDLSTPIENGDLLTVTPVTEHKELVVSLAGHVHHPGEFLWRPDLRVSDIVKNVQQLKPGADLDFALIRREQPPVGLLTAIFVDLGSALAQPNSAADLVLFPRDQLQIFSYDQPREMLVAPLVEALKAQSRSGAMARVVSVSGRVKSPGEYPLTDNMTLTQLVAAAGGLTEDAYLQRVELSRYDFADAEQASSSHRSVNLAKAYENPELNLSLEPYDKLSNHTIPEFRETLQITLQGEVQFPGVYTFSRGETLSSVIRRAGGLTQLAHSKAAVFMRESLRTQEQERLEELKGRLQADIAAASVERINEGKSSELSDAKTLLDELTASEAVGRLVINLAAVLDGGNDDVKLKDGDVLVVPEYRQEVAVLGEVQQPTAHLFRAGFDIHDYINLSGGTNSRADHKRTYLVKADGSVIIPKRSGWLSRKHIAVEPGDTVVVPLDIDRKDNMVVWTEASQIIYQLALGAAAVSNLK